MSLITQLADAITRMEGYFPGSVAYRNNNPGNLRAGAIYPQYPVDSRGFTIFPDPATGRAALENDMRAKVNRGMTLESLIYQYAPPTDNNNSAGYVASVASWTGLPTNVPLNTLGSQSSMLPEDSFLANLSFPWSTDYPDTDYSGASTASTDAGDPYLWIGLGVLGVAVAWMFLER